MPFPGALSTDIFKYTSAARIQTEEQRICFLEEQLNALTKQLSFLKNSIPELEEASIKMRSLVDTINSKKIVLSEPGNKEFDSFQESLITVKQSKKINAVGDTSAKEFFDPQVPEDLSFFSSTSSHALVFIRPFTYAIFPRVILCFDTNGLFSTALSIEALSLTISRNQEHVFVFNESFNSQYTLPV